MEGLREGGTCADGKIERFTCTDSIIKISRYSLVIVRSTRMLPPPLSRTLPPFPRISCPGSLSPILFTFDMPSPCIFALFNEKTFQIASARRPSVQRFSSSLSRPVLQIPPPRPLQKTFPRRKLSRRIICVLYSRVHYIIPNTPPLPLRIDPLSSARIVNARTSKGSCKWRRALKFHSSRRAHFNTRKRNGIPVPRVSFNRFEIRNTLGI